MATILNKSCFLDRNVEVRLPPIKRKEKKKEKTMDDKRVKEKIREDDIYKLPTLVCLIIQRFEGETCEGHGHGEGVAWFKGGHKYKGTFTKGLMDGTGVFTWADGLKYEGDFVCNMPMGQGTFTWPNGSSYQGEVYNCLRHGTGTYTCGVSGVSYTGQWDRGKRHGEGAVYYNQSKTSWYEGNWVRNNREGSGVRCYPSGNIYSGERKNNLRHGEGTMMWLKLGQEYAGMWQDGVQHGRGTHVWILRRPDGTQYSQSNRYTGDFAGGQRHGQGAFFYAGGAVYEGEWKNNKKDGKGKFTFKDGHVYKGEFEDDQMMAPSADGRRALTPPCGVSPLSDIESSVLGPDMALNIESLLDEIPERTRQTERKQVEFVVMRNDAELRSIYTFYSRLGHVCSADNTFLLSRLQLWRLLKDCQIHHHDFTLTQMNHFIKDETTTQIHSPFTSMPLRGLPRCLVIMAYHIYKNHMASEKYLLAACLSKLITDDILPNAKNVKGFLFGRPDRSLVAMDYMTRCWEMYQTCCQLRTPSNGPRILTYRQLLWMFKDLGLLDNNLTTVKLVEIMTAESRDPTNLTYCLKLPITYLEFFEVLLGCAEVKGERLSESPEEQDSESQDETEHLPEVAEVEDTEEIATSSPTQLETESAELYPAQEILDAQPEAETEVSEQPQSSELTEEHQEEVYKEEEEDIRSTETEAEDQTIHHFFNHYFFPAFHHLRSLTNKMEIHRQNTEHPPSQGPTK